MIAIWVFVFSLTVMVCPPLPDGTFEITPRAGTAQSPGQRRLDACAGPKDAAGGGRPSRDAPAWRNLRNGNAGPAHEKMRASKRSRGDAVADKVQAAVRTGPSRTEIREYPMPEVPADAALLKMEVAGICGTDVKLYAE